jgi:uncharacterized membrane protein
MPQSAFEWHEEQAEDTTISTVVYSGVISKIFPVCLISFFLAICFYISVRDFASFPGQGINFSLLRPEIPRFFRTE